MNMTFGEVPDDEDLDKASRIAVLQLLESDDIITKAEGIRLVRRDILPQQPQSGGLAILNVRPEMFAGIIAAARSGDIPFADATALPAQNPVTTIVEPSE